MLHYTLIFQVFVFMQIFNLINSRKIAEGEINVFKNFFDEKWRPYNKWFFIIFVVTILI
jgi:Ca2+ transporting ATPase